MLKHFFNAFGLLLLVNVSIAQEIELECERFTHFEDAEYVLPFEAGSTFSVTNTVGHYRAANGGVGLYAIDFRMPIGTTIVAARSGVAVAVRDHFKDGNGIDLKENFIFLQHADSTIARYFHLTQGGARVKVGDNVLQGESIATSGNTGQSAYPHLHFDVQKCGPNLPPNYNQLPCGMTIPISFRNTSPHVCGLEAGKAYEALD